MTTKKTAEQDRAAEHRENLLASRKSVSVSTTASDLIGLLQASAALGRAVHVVTYRNKIEYNHAHGVPVEGGDVWAVDGVPVMEWVEALGRYVIRPEVHFVEPVTEPVEATEDPEVEARHEGLLAEVLRLDREAEAMRGEHKTVTSERNRLMARAREEGVRVETMMQVLGKSRAWVYREASAGAEA